jgi:small subunit ribosomal protein S5
MAAYTEKSKKKDIPAALIAEEKAFPYEKLVSVSRNAKVVKGGRRFSFGAVVVIGNGKGEVGYSLGKASEVADAIKKATLTAQKHILKIKLKGTTIPHEVIGKFRGGKVIMKPAAPGTGIIAGGAVRAVCEAAGIKDVLTKSLGSQSPLNVLQATLEAVRSLSLSKERFDEEFQEEEEVTAESGKEK